MKVSIIVPCHSNHFSLLRPLLQSYQTQSVQPDEVVVSLSNAKVIDGNEIRRLEKHPWPFRLRIIQSPDQVEAGINRNIACEASQGDLFICQDADDIPHRRRVQVIKHLFENFKIDFLIHQFVFDFNFSQINLQTVSDLCHRVRGIDHKWLTYIQQGSPALTRRVFEQVQWANKTDVCEDGAFNGKVFDRFDDSFILSIPLIWYRPELSAWDK